MSILSERMHAFAPNRDKRDFLEVQTFTIRKWADEVEALEGQLVMWEGNYRTLSKLLNEKKDSPTDTLKHNYEKLGLSSALVVNNKYGKHSAFGYQGRE